MENTNETPSNKKEQIAIAVGFLLILIVILITLFRSSLFSDKDIVQDEGQVVKEDTGLEYKTINAKDLHKKILLAKEDEQPVLLDIRPFQTYADEHITDAINITPEEFPLGQKIDMHKLIIIIGENPEDENIKKAIYQLKDEGSKNFVVLAGGMEAWKQLVGLTVNYGNPDSFEDQMKVSYVEGKDLNDAIKQNVPTYILDVRTPEEYAKGHLPGAINIPADELEKRRKEIKEKRIIVVGINELQEFQSSVQLYDMIMVSPFVLKGAMSEWEKNGYPMQK